MYIRYTRLYRRYWYVIVILPLLFIIWYAVFWESHQREHTELPKLISQDQSKDSETFLLVIILTGPKNKDRRDAIRKTWLSKFVDQNIEPNRPSKVRYFFVLGTKGLDTSLYDSIQKEQTLYKDLLLFEDFIDAYEKLTAKLGRMLMWVSENVNFKYLFKCDDDTYARIDSLQTELMQRYTNSPKEMLYYGYFYGKGQVKKSGPWKETEWQLCDRYIPYARGGGYIISQNIVDYVAANFARFKKYLSEDVSLGAWLAPLEVNRVHDKRFDTEYKSRGCSNTFVVCHKQTIEDMHEKYGSLSNTGMLCKTEFSTFNGYDYDWSVPPSQCCIRKKGIP